MVTNWRMEACHSIDVGFDRFRTLPARCRAAVSAEVKALMVASRLACPSRIMVKSPEQGGITITSITSSSTDRRLTVAEKVRRKSKLYSTNPSGTRCDRSEVYHLRAIPAFYRVPPVYQPESWDDEVARP